MTDNGLTTEEQARQFALGQVRDAVSQEVSQHIESWLSLKRQCGSAGERRRAFHRQQERWFIPGRITTTI